MKFTIFLDNEDSSDTNEKENDEKTNANNNNFIVKSKIINFFTKIKTNLF